MKALIVGNWSADRQLSMLGFSAGLAEIMRARGHEVDIVSPTATAKYRAARPFLGDKWAAYIDKYTTFPAQLRQAAKGYDIVHIADHSNAVYGPRIGHRRWLVTLHDLLPSRAALGELDYWQVGFTGRQLQAWIRRSLRQAPVVHSISQATTDDALRLCPPDSGRIETIPNCLYQQLPIPKPAPDPRPRFLHLGGAQPYKDKPSVVAVFAALKERSEFRSARLVLAGREPGQALRGRIDALGLAGSVEIRTGVSNEALAQIWAETDALLFLSRNEGFGLPILEAQHAGVLCVTTDRAPMNDILGGGGLAVDPLMPAEAAQSIVDAWPERCRLIEAGKRNLERFRREEMAERIEALWREAADGA